MYTKSQHTAQIENQAKTQSNKEQYNKTLASRIGTKTNHMQEQVYTRSPRVHKHKETK